MNQAEAFGEHRHETCVHGSLTPIFLVPLYAQPHIPAERSMAPLCRWSPSEPHPPALDRAWGGLVDYAKDCAMCAAHAPVEAVPFTLNPRAEA